MARLRLFGPAREAAGTPSTELAGKTVGDVLDAATAQFGPVFATVVASSRIWVNGEAAGAERAVDDDDEVAVVPPVSWG